MNNLFLHRSLTEYKYSFLNRVLTSDIIYGDSGSFNSRSNIWTYQYEQVFPMLYGEGYAIHEHLAPFELVYLKELTGIFAEGPDIGTSGFYNSLSIDDDLGNVNSSIETGCNTHRQTDWVKDKPGQEAYFDKNVTSKDDPDLKGRIYVGKTFRELRENNFLYYGDEKGDLHQLPLPIFGLEEDTREADGQGGHPADQYGSTPGERASNPQFWIDLLLSEGGFAPAPGVQSVTIADNPLNWVMGGGGASGAKLYRGALGIFKSTLLTNVGRALTKHPEVLGYSSTEALMQIFRNQAAINKAASTALKNIMRTGIRP